MIQAQPTYKQVPSFPSLFVSETGDVLRLSDGQLQPLKPSLISDGYAAVATVNKRTCYVHRLVCEAFHGQPFSYRNTKGRMQKAVVNHKDADKTNNHASNLEWTTQQQNVRHTVNQGRMSNRKITSNAVSEIRKFYADGWKQTDIGKLYNLSQGVISRIVNHYVHKHAV